MIRMKKTGNYLLKQDDTKKFYLEEQPAFTLPKVVYGDLATTTSRVLTTFKGEDNSVGCLFSGIKGNSKTTMAKNICLKAKMPIIMITEPFCGSEFKGFLSSLKDNVTIFIDEFEKVYSTHELQQEFLTILDGVFQSKKLFLFTSNDTNINSYLRNRPSRIYYHFKYDNLDPKVVDDIIDKELINKSHEADLRAVLLILGTVSMDVLLKFIGEVNRFDKSPRELIKGMNIEVEQTEFSVVMIIKGKRFTTKCSFNPLVAEEFVLDYKDDKDHYRWFSGLFSDYTMYTRGGAFIFENVDNKLIFTPFKSFKFEL